MKKITLMLIVLSATTAAGAQSFTTTNNTYTNGWQQSGELNRSQFADLLKLVNNTPFAEDKKNAFSSAMQNKYIRVSQVSDLLKLFSFDDDKLAWAKLAYRYTADIQSFYTLRNSFAFITTQNDFDQFLMKMSDRSRFPGRRNAAVLNRREFAQLKNTINNAPFADGKKKAFRLALQNSYITVAQLSDLLKQFNFDDEKVDWALMAYDYTADTENFYQLRDTFTFISSKQKLDDFLSRTSK